MIEKLKNLYKENKAEIVLFSFISLIFLFLFALVAGTIIVKNEHKKYGLKKGVVVSYKYNPEKDETTMTNRMDMNGQPTIEFRDDSEPASYRVNVEGNGREEIWETNDMSKTINIGDTLNINDGWMWIGTTKIPR